MTEPTTNASLFEGFEAFLRVRGASFDALLETAGLTREDLDDPDKTISLNAAARMLEAAAAETHDPCLGLHWAEAIPRGASGVLGYLILNAKSPRTLLEVLVRYISLLVEPIEVSFVEKDGVGSLEWRFPVSFDAPRLQYGSFAMAMVVLRLRQIAGKNWTPQIELEHRALDCPQEAARILGPNVLYDQPVNAVRLPQPVLNRTSATADERLFGLIRNLGERMLAEKLASADILDITRQAIVVQLEAGAATLEDVAAAISMDRRRLQIELAEAGSNFETLLHETRQSLAQTYLRDTDLPLTQIAFLLGFSELSAFTRAATRWFGVPPRQYRSILRNSA